MLSMVFLMHCNQITCQLKGNNSPSWDLKNFEVFTCSHLLCWFRGAYFFRELRDQSLPPWCHSSRGVLNVPSSSVLKRAFAALTETAAQHLSKSQNTAVVLWQRSLILVLPLQRFLIAYQSKSGLMVNCCFRWELILGLGSLRNWSILNSRVFNPLGDKTISHPFVGANYSKDCQLPLVKIKKWTSQWILDLSLWNMTKFVKDLSWYTSWDGEQARVDFMHRFAKKMPGKKWNTHIYIYIYVLPWWFTIKNG